MYQNDIMILLFILNSLRDNIKHRAYQNQTTTEKFEKSVNNGSININNLTKIAEYSSYLFTLS